MSLRKTKIVDTNFAHALYSTDYQTSKCIEWVRGSEILNNDIVFFTDNSLIYNANFNCNKIGLLMEPRAINPSIYEWVKTNYNNFDTILTFDKELINISSNIIFYPHSGCWIKHDDQKVYDKDKLLSIIASQKNDTVGHKLRHQAIKSIISKTTNFDIFGRAYNPIDYKLEALKNYAFSIVIENSKSDYYFTEKLIDSFMTGTVPIYWGCPSIGNFFNLNGILVFNDINDLLLIINSLSFEKYNLMLGAINENYEKAKEFLIAEDWIYKNTKIFK